MAAALLTLCLSGMAWGQATAERMTDETINAARQLEIIDSITAAIDSFYVFPDVATRMIDRVREQYRNGEYRELTSAVAFAQALDRDMGEICKDGHFGVRWSPPGPDVYGNSDTLTDVQRERILDQRRYANFGFQKIERLPGNVGYLDLRGFNDASMAGPTAVAAMNFLAYSDAIIIDLRQNGGGSPSMIQLISSYFFEEPTHLNTFYVRETDSLQQFWTSASVQGPRMTDVDLYILTSGYTYSAAEEFTYNMKNLERATIIGQTTGGGAHPVADHYFVSLNFSVRVPFGRAINPITGTNWEGTGVTPHIEVPVGQELQTAHLEALKKLSEKETEYPEKKARIDWYLAGLQAKLKPAVVDDAVLKSYVGVYGPRNILFEDGKLYYQRTDRPKYLLIPISQTLFMLEDLDYFRLEVALDDAGNPVELRGHYDNGNIDVS